MQHLPHDLCFVFSAHAEVVPVFPGPCQVWWGILRARGGSSPSYPISGGSKIVFSAHAEVVHFPINLATVENGILRARGGSSVPILISLSVQSYSPRTRR